MADIGGFLQRNKKTLSIVLFIIVLAVIYRFVADIDFEKLKGFMKEMPTTFVAIFILFVFHYLMATLAWRLCMGDEARRVPLIDLYMIRHVGEMLGLYNPTSIVAGEGLKVYYVKKWGVSNTVALSSILLARLLLVLSSVLLLIVGIGYMLFQVSDDTFFVGIVSTALVIVVAMTIVLVRLMMHEDLILNKRVRSWAQRTQWKMWRPELLDKIEEINYDVAQYFKQHRNRFFLAFVFSIFHWLLAAAEFYIILKALDIDVSILGSIAVEMGVVFFKSMGAIIPGQLGVEEYGNKIMFDIIGITSNEIWMATSLMRRARQLAYLAVAGIFAWILRIRIKNLQNAQA